MFRIYDTICKECNNIEEVFIEKEKDLPKCSACGGKAERVFTSFNFRLKYNNKTDVCGWADTGYAKSQYWRKVKEAEKKTGKKHKGINE